MTPARFGHWLAQRCRLFAAITAQAAPTVPNDVQLIQFSMIQLLEVKGDDTLLIDHGACGHIKVWRAAGAPHLTATVEKPGSSGRVGEICSLPPLTR